MCHCGAPAAKEQTVQASVAPDLNLATLAALGDGLLSKLSSLRWQDPLFWSDS